jgi:hypothetical protein
MTFGSVRYLRGAAGARTALHTAEGLLGLQGLVLLTVVWVIDALKIEMVRCNRGDAYVDAVNAQKESGLLILLITTTHT